MGQSSINQITLIKIPICERSFVLVGLFFIFYFNLVESSLNLRGIAQGLLFWKSSNLLRQCAGFFFRIPQALYALFNVVLPRFLSVSPAPPLSLSLPPPGSRSGFVSCAQRRIPALLPGSGSTLCAGQVHTDSSSPQIAVSVSSQFAEGDRMVFCNLKVGGSALARVCVCTRVFTLAGFICSAHTHTHAQTTNHKPQTQTHPVISL